MEFFLIVAGVIAALLLLAYLHDRRRKGQVGDVSARAHGGGVAQGQVENFRLHLPDTPENPGPGGTAP